MSQYQNVFSNIKKKVDLPTYEQEFNKITGESYKDFLHQKFIVENISKGDIALLVGATSGAIIRHTQLYNIKKPSGNPTITNEDNLYNKTPSQVAEEQGRDFLDIYNELEAKGMSLTEITAHLNIRSVSTVSGYVQRYKKKAEGRDIINEDNLIFKGLAGKNHTTIDRIIQQELGMSYKEFLQRKYIEEKMTLGEIYHITGISTDSLSIRLKAYGINKSRKQVSQQNIEKGLINYDDINRKARQSRAKSISKSNKQDLFRQLFKHHVENKLTNNTYSHLEIITGYSEWSILNNLEIDIPIIVFNQSQVLKIALEYNGDYWHNRNRHDQTKKDLLAANGWIYYEIEETNKESSNLGYLEEQTKNIVDNLFTLIHNQLIKS
jgi:hypothetical protein